MSENAISGSGNKIKIFVANLPLGDRSKPTDIETITVGTVGLSTITAGANLTTQTGDLTTDALPFALPIKTQLLFSGGALLEVTTAAADAATTVAVRVIQLPPNYTDGNIVANEETCKVVDVTALASPIGAGTPLAFSGGALAFLGGDAITTGTVLTFLPTADGYDYAIAAAETSSYQAFSRITGSTDAPLALTPNRSTFTLHSSTFQQGVITSQTGSVNITANVISGDYGRHKAEYASLNGVAGREVYVEYEDNEKTVEFVAQIDNFNQANPADGIITMTFNLNFQGDPINYRKKLVAA